MHPWGKWGRNFVEYGVVAAQAALADAGVEWRDIQFVSGADTMRNGYPGIRRRRDVRPGTRLAGRVGRVVVRGVREWCDGTERGPGSDPRRALRCGARRRCRHDPERLPGAERGRTGRRSGLAPLPAARRDQPDVLRALRPAAHGDLRRHPRRLRQGQGEERASRAVQPQRAVPQGSDARRDQRRADRGRPAAPARDLRDVRRGGRGGHLEHGVREVTWEGSPGAGGGDLDRDAELPEHRSSRCRRSRPTPRHGVAAPTNTFRDSIAAAAYEQSGLGPDDLDLAEVYDLSTALELDWYENIGLCKPGEAERLLNDGDTTIGGRVPVNPSGGWRASARPFPRRRSRRCARSPGTCRERRATGRSKARKVGLTVNQGLFGHGSCVILRNSG